MTLYDEAEMESSIAQVDAEESKKMSHADKVAKAEALKNKYVSDMNELGYSQEEAVELAGRKSDKDVLAEAQKEKGHPVRTAVAVGGLVVAAVPVVGATAAEVKTQHMVNGLSNAAGALFGGEEAMRTQRLIDSVESMTKLNSGHGGRER